MNTWYNDTAAKEMSVQLDENDDHTTVTEGCRSAPAITNGKY